MEAGINESLRNADENAGTSEPYCRSFDEDWVTNSLENFELEVGTKLDKSALTETSNLLRNRLRYLITRAKVLTIHGRRSKMICEDISLVRGFDGEEEPFGKNQNWNAPISTGLMLPQIGLHPRTQQTLDLYLLAQSPGAKLPGKIQLKSHWLTIEGVQPCIQENPNLKENSITLDKEKCEWLNEAFELNDKIPPAIRSLYFVQSFVTGAMKPNENMDSHSIKGEPVTFLQSLPWLPTVSKSIITSPQKDDRDYVNDSIIGKSGFAQSQLVNNPSAMHRTLYTLIITLLTSEDEMEQLEALQIISNNAGLQYLLPRLSVYICEGVRCHIGSGAVHQSIRMMKILEAMLSNNANDLSKLLCDLIPTCLSCVLASRLCDEPSNTDQWNLRRFAATLVVRLCQKHEKTDNVARLTRLLSDQWIDSDKVALTTLYGAIYTLFLLGTEVMNKLCLPHLPNVSKRIETAMTLGPDDPTYIEANELYIIIIYVFSEWVIEHGYLTLGSVASFEAKFGYFGEGIHQVVSDEDLKLHFKTLANQNWNDDIDVSTSQTPSNYSTIQDLPIILR